MTRCTNCAKEETIKLIDGRRVCNYCPDYLLECEARQLLRLPLWRRREQLDARLKPRGELAVNRLKTVMGQIFERQRK